MSLRCKGCGIKLQSDNPEEKGYVVNLEQDYCQRCYKLVHYGDITHYKHENFNENLEDIFNNHKKDLFVLIVDCYEALILDQEEFLDNFKDKNILLIINKIDTLPNSVTEDKIVSIYKEIFIKLKKKHKNLLDMIITHKFDISFNELFKETINDLGFKTVLFIGKTNAGKSTILNKLLNKDYFTTSIYPGTTVDEIPVGFDDYTFIDTPGIDDNDNILTYLPITKLKSFLRYKTVKPLVFQLYEPQSYYMSKIFRIDVIPKNNCSIIFESNRNDIHRTKMNNHDYDKRNNFEFKIEPWTKSNYVVNSSQAFLIKGFGLIRIKGSCKVIFNINDKIKIYPTEVSI